VGVTGRVFKKKDWFDLAQDSAKCRALLNMATTSGSKKCQEFLEL
jgi:hypothetical protein